MPVARVVATVAAGLAALAGCTSSAEPTPAPTPTISSSPSSSPSPSATPPTMPAEAEGTSPRAAKAFVRYYIASVNDAMATGETRHLAGLASHDCAPCGAIVTDINDAYAGGGHLEGNGWSIRRSQYFRIAPSTALVSLSLEISEQVTYKANGETQHRSKATRGHMDVRVKHSRGSWRVVGLEATQ